MSPPTKKPQKHLTQGGYLKADVYREFEDAVLRQDHERVCYLAAELACTRGEARPFLSFVVQLYGQHFLSSNAWVLRALRQHLEGAASAARKQACAEDEAFQKHVCQAVLLVSQERPKSIGAMLKAACAKPTSDRVMVVDGKAAIADRYGEQLPEAVATALGAMLLHGVRGDAPGALRSLQAALSAPGAVAPAPFEFVRHLGEAQRRDAAWYAWDVLLTESRKAPRQRAVREYVHHALALYLFGYQKKVRAARLNYVFYALFVLAHRAAKCVDRNTALVRGAAKRINIVFSETLGLPAHRLEYLQYVTTAS
jgi:hypothetical protein